MRISKSLRVVCAAAVALAPLSLRAADSDAQIKAREALEKSLQESPPLQTNKSQPAAAAPRKQKKAPPAPGAAPPAQPKLAEPPAATKTPSPPAAAPARP